MKINGNQNKKKVLHTAIHYPQFQQKLNFYLIFHLNFNYIIHQNTMCP